MWFWKACINPHLPSIPGEGPGGGECPPECIGGDAVVDAAVVAAAIRAVAAAVAAVTVCSAAAFPHLGKAAALQSLQQ